MVHWGRWSILYYLNARVVSNFSGAMESLTRPAKTLARGNIVAMCIACMEVRCWYAVVVEKW
jgi:hypothetical protein